jgi:hypothetical protein
MKKEEEGGRGKEMRRPWPLTGENKKRTKGHKERPRKEERKKRKDEEARKSGKERREMESDGSGEPHSELWTKDKLCNF